MATSTAEKMRRWRAAKAGLGLKGTGWQDQRLHTYTAKCGNQWQAFCLDFCLAAQGDSEEEAQEKLDDMMTEWCFDVLSEDRQYADQLLRRKAQLWDWVKYYWHRRHAVPLS